MPTTKCLEALAALQQALAATLAEPVAEAVDCELNSQVTVDTVDYEPAPEPAPAPDPAPKPKPLDGHWLFRIATRRHQLPWFRQFGVDHGYPRDMLKWSPKMVEKAIDAWTKARQVTATNGRQS